MHTQLSVIGTSGCSLRYGAFTHKADGPAQSTSPSPLIPHKWCAVRLAGNRSPVQLCLNVFNPVYPSSVSIQFEKNCIYIKISYRIIPIPHFTLRVNAFVFSNFYLGSVMNIKQLRALREVMLTGSVSKAAKNLYRTQPAVSAQISTLEKEVGLKLFDRIDGRLQPVPEAEYVLEKTMEILDNIDEVEQSLLNIKSLEVGDINIVSMLGPSIFLIPQITSDFLKDKEHINLSLLSYNSHKTQELLSTQKFDVGIIDFQDEQYQNSSLVHHDLLQYKCLCAVPADDPLAEKPFIDIKDLNGKAMAMLQDDHSVTKQLKNAFRKHGLKLKRRIKTQYFIPQLTFVEQGLAYAIIDPLTVTGYQLYRKQLGSIAFVPFAPTITSTISIVTPTKRPLSKVATAFVEHLKKELSVLQ